MINGMFIMSFSKSLVAQQAPPSVSNRNTKGSNTRTLNVSFKFPLPPPQKSSSNFVSIRYYLLFKTYIN